MISRTSRYADRTVGLVDSSRGPVVTILPKDPESRTFKYTSVLVETGDRVDLIAARMYGDGAQWWRIADANPEIMDWFDIPVGTELRIPSA